MNTLKIPGYMFITLTFYSGSVPTWCLFVMTSTVIFSLPIIIQTDRYLKLILVSSVSCSSDQLERRDDGGNTFRQTLLVLVSQDSATLESVRQRKPPGSPPGNCICGKEVSNCEVSRVPFMLGSHQVFEHDCILILSYLLIWWRIISFLKKTSSLYLEFSFSLALISLIGFFRGRGSGR